jgi:hypothetical protein
MGQTHQMIQQSRDAPVRTGGGSGEVIVVDTEQQGSQHTNRRVEVQRHTVGHGRPPSVVFVNTTLRVGYDSSARENGRFHG